MKFTIITFETGINETFGIIIKVNTLRQVYPYSAANNIIMALGVIVKNDKLKSNRI